MKVFRFTQFILLLGILGSMSNGSLAYQCWTDEDGNTACEDVCAATFTERFYEVCPQGALVDEVGRAKTPKR
ncbi:MAG: hypothetical protein R3E08_04335 [Thiotrichaceae bacterium]